MAYSASYRYTREHEWINVDGDEGTVGITDYAQASLGDIVFVELPKVGAELGKGQTFGTVESVKAVSELYSPVSGTVTAVNEDLNEAPEQINTDANIAWILKVKIANPAELESLLSVADYEKYIAEETAH